MWQEWRETQGQGHPEQALTQPGWEGSLEVETTEAKWDWTSRGRVFQARESVKMPL